jgi:Phage integrase, N-terminal SAM-like domain
MAHISRRQRNGKVRYLAWYTDPSGRERAKSFTRKKDAERFLTGIESDKLRGTWTDPTLGRVHLEDWYALWRRATVELRPNTEARDERLFRLHILPRFGSMPLVAITRYEVRAWVTHATRQGLAASTVRRAYQLLGKVLGAAVDAGMIAQNPCRRVPLPRIERREMRFLTPAEVARLADSIRPNYRALVLLGAYGGLRIGEMAGLRRGRVDLDHGMVEVAEIVTEVSGYLHVGPPKTRAGYRRVGLPGSWSRPWQSSWPVLGPPTTWCSWVRKVARCGWPVSGIASGVRQPGRPAWMGCASTTCGTRRWRCGSRPAPIPRRSPPGPGTPRSASPWTATATSIRTPIRRSGTAWTRCMRSPRHANPHTLTTSDGPGGQLAAGTRISTTAAQAVTCVAGWWA